MEHGDSQQQLMLPLGGRLAFHTQSPDSDKAWRTLAETLHSNIFHFLSKQSRVGLYSKTSMDFCHQTEEKTLAPSSGTWHNSGMGSPTRFLTLNTTECHNDDDDCSLSDILEIGDVPPRYYLSQRACKGILRREKTRPIKLNPILKTALQKASLEPCAQTATPEAIPAKTLIPTD